MAPVLNSFSLLFKFRRIPVIIDRKNRSYTDSNPAAQGGTAGGSESAGVSAYVSVERRAGANISAEFLGEYREDASERGNASPIAVASERDSTAQQLSGGADG